MLLQWELINTFWSITIQDSQSCTVVRCSAFSLLSLWCHVLSPQDNLYANIAVTNPTNTLSDSASAHQDEVLYASVVPRRAVDPRNAESSAVKSSASEDGEVQYASVRFKRTTTADYRWEELVCSLQSNRAGNDLLDLNVIIFSLSVGLPMLRIPL